MLPILFSITACPIIFYLLHIHSFYRSYAIIPCLWFGFDTLTKAVLYYIQGLVMMTPHLSRSKRMMRYSLVDIINTCGTFILTVGQPSQTQNASPTPTHHRWTLCETSILDSLVLSWSANQVRWNWILQDLVKIMLIAQLFILHINAHLRLFKRFIFIVWVLQPYIE